MTTSVATRCEADIRSPGLVVALREAGESMGGDINKQTNKNSFNGFHMVNNFNVI